jgi:DNA repair exonuclease SbcCD ATPase subunit
MKSEMRERFQAALLAAVFSVASVAQAAVDFESVERLVAEGKSADAIPILEKELTRHPRDAKLLYNYGVACYASGKFDDALLAFDKVEASRNSTLVEKARAQKGNAEFRLGLNAKTDNLDETIERWKTSLDHYKGALKTAPRDVMAKNNHDKVQKLLMEILLKQAQQKLDQGLKDNWADRKIEELREAMEKFQEAVQVDPASQPAKEGEKTAREELAKTLAKEGEKKATPKADQSLDYQISQVEKGVEMLEDAHDLLPEDKPIEEALETAKENLAKVLTEKAKQDIQQARETQWPKGKFDKLESAVEKAERAQELDAKNEEAKQVAEEAKEELAKLHEEQGDQLAELADRSSLPQQTQRLEAALDHYNEALDIKETPQLVAKAEQTEEKLANALEKLADKLLQEPPKPEQLEEKTARYEQAQTTLQDLDELRPSDKTDQKLDDVEKKLAELRQQLAEQARQQLAMEKAQQQKAKPQIPQPGQAQVEEKPDLEQPPPQAKPPKTGFKSDELTRKGKDY